MKFLTLCLAFVAFSSSALAQPPEQVTLHEKCLNSYDFVEDSKILTSIGYKETIVGVTAARDFLLVNCSDDFYTKQMSSGILNACVVACKNAGETDQNCKFSCRTAKMNEAISFLQGVESASRIMLDTIRKLEGEGSCTDKSIAARIASAWAAKKPTCQASPALAGRATSAR